MSEHTDEITRALVQAADAARYAPSIHNTQPWRWVVRAGRLELFGVPDQNNFRARFCHSFNEEGHLA